MDRQRPHWAGPSANGDHIRVVSKSGCVEGRALAPAVRAVRWAEAADSSEGKRQLKGFELVLGSERQDIRRLPG